jgi:pimeloyl-ACP methyl ester carboxylesterase
MNQRLMERQRPEGMATDLAACNDYVGAADAASRVACPTLVVTGDEDRMTPAAAAQPLVERLTDVRVIRLACGHAFMTEAPAALAGALEDFLA